MDQLRILHVIFSSRIAGSERYAVDLANRQAALGHEVHVAGIPESPLASALTNAVRFHGFNSRFFRGLRLRHLIRTLSPDICHGHLSPACKALAGTSKHVVKVATLHVGYKRHQHARLDGLICVNRTQTAQLSLYRGLVHVIPNWLPATSAAATAPGVRAELGLSKDAFLVGAVGRLHQSKGMDVLISAFRISSPPDAALVILGEGPQLSKLKKLRAGDKRIHLLGYRENVTPVLADLNLFISPSREESFGLAILEAMSVGLPIIATSTEGPREIQLNQPIALVEPGSVAALTRAITEAHDRFRARQLSRLTYDLSRFEPAARLESITSLYNRAIETKHGFKQMAPLAQIS